MCTVKVGGLNFVGWICTAMSENLYIIPGGIGAGRYVTLLISLSMSLSL